MTDDEIRAAAVSMRKRAVLVGMQSSLWDVIFDCEALLEGRQTLVPRDVIENMIREYERDSATA